MEEEADISSSKCPLPCSDDNEGTLASDDDPKGDNDMIIPAPKRAPYQWWKFGLLNFLQLKRHGWIFYQYAMESNKSTVFTVKLEEWTTCVCDHVGMKSVLDLNKVQRDDTGHGFLNFRRHMMRDHTPCLWSNDEAHDKKKAFLLSFVKDIYDNMPNKVVGVIRKEFEQMKPIKFSNAADAKRFDFERAFLNAANNITTYMLVGEYFEDTSPIDEWRSTIFQMEGIFGPPGDTVGMTDKVFEMFSSVKKLKDLTSKFVDSGLDEKEMFNEALYMTCSNATPGMQIYTLNSLICYIRLPESDKELLREDAERFFSANYSYREVLPTLHHLHAFFMEVIRVHPLPVIYGRAKKDFVLKSTSGDFSIKKNDNLCGMPYFSHRDEKLFDQAGTFDMHRDVKQTEKYNFGYGGYYLAQPSEQNHKCAGDMLSMEMIKLLILFYTRCTFVTADEPIFTGRNLFRKYASDKPLTLLEFSYNNADLHSQTNNQ